MNSNKQSRIAHSASRANSCNDLLGKSGHKTDHSSAKQRQQSTKQKQESLIHNLLRKNTSSHKGIFTDETTYSYRPQVTNLPMDLYPDTRSQIEMSKQKIMERLIENMKQKQENLKLIKLQKDEEEFKSTCSFVPKINKSSKAMVLERLKTETNEGSGRVFERLYEEGVNQIIEKEKEYMSGQDNKLTEEHTFQPEINAMSKEILNSESRNLEPIFVRFNQVIERKRVQQKLIEEKKMREIEEKAEVKITNKKTLEIIESNPNYQSQNGGNNVVRRLLDNYLKQKKQKTQHIQFQEEQKLKTQCPFKPTINTNYVLMNASSFNPDQQFLQRQNQFLEQHKENIQFKANQLVPTFRPQINKLSQLICKEREFQTMEDKLNRLHYEPIDEKEQQIQKLQASLYKECKFYPEINEISKALQGPLKPHACKCHPTPVNYNFTPAINQKSKKMKNSKSIELQSKLKKQEKTNKIKMEKQYKEIVSCTFQPMIKNLNKDKLKFNQNTQNLVSGVREFLEKKTKAINKKKQDQEYKEKVFNLEKRYKNRTNTTVEEFKLSHQVYFGKEKKALIQDAQQNFKKQHPFRPKIQSIR